MSTAAQIEANRANAQHSTGPVTEEGKANSSRNSTSHGLTSKELHIPEHLKAEYDILRDDLFEDLYPDTPVEHVLFEMALASAWKLRRCDIAESQLDTMVSRPGLQPLLDPTLAPTINTLERVRAQAGKALIKATSELRKIQTERQFRDAAMPEEAGFDWTYAGLANWQSIRAHLLRHPQEPIPGAKSEPSFLEKVLSLPPDYCKDVPEDVLHALDVCAADPTLNPWHIDCVADYFLSHRSDYTPSGKTKPIAASAA